MKYTHFYTLLLLNLASFSYAATGASATEDEHAAGAVTCASASEHNDEFEAIMFGDI